MSASRVEAPCSFAISMKSMSRIEFLTTIPARRMIPMKADMDCCFPAIKSDHMAPIRARGMADMIVKGWTKERKAGTREK